MSQENVQATMEIPNNHQGILRPPKKNSVELLADRLDTITPIRIITIKKAPMMIQSMAAKFMTFS